jgi:hypothetical protein
MVLRETGASWLASMMRAEREPEERSALLDAAPEPERLEALERLSSPLGGGGSARLRDETEGDGAGSN